MSYNKLIIIIIIDSNIPFNLKHIIILDIVVPRDKFLITSINGAVTIPNISIPLIHIILDSLILYIIVFIRPDV